MKRIGLAIIETGIIGYLIGACTMDGPDTAKGIAMMAICLFVAVIGYWMYDTGKKRQERQAEMKREISQAREAVFKNWIELKMP